MKFVVRPSFIVLLLTATALHYGCGKSGKGGDTTEAIRVPTSETINGSIVSQTGGQREMAGWVVVLSEKDTGVSRVAEVDQVGSFSLKGVDTTKYHTIVLLSPDYKLAAVLSMPSSASPAGVRQFFKLKSKALPRLIHKGPIVEFFATYPLEVAPDFAVDTDGDGIPNGMDASANGLLLAPPVDTDRDGIPNDKDFDIDGDGIPNIFDTDADGDGTLNVFDRDANGDAISDAAQKNGIQYFADGAEFIAVQLITEPQTSGPDRVLLIVSTRVRDGVNPTSVRVRGSQALLNAATVEDVDAESDAVTSQPFDGTLVDGTAGDGVYTREIILAADKYPKSNQVLFVQLAFGEDSAVWFKEYAYTFPNITLGSVSVAYDSNVQTLSIQGTPFGSIEDYVWSANVFNADGIKVHSTPVTPGNITMQQLPDDLLESGQSYETVIYAQSIAPVPGYPAYIIKSSPSAM